MKTAKEYYADTAEGLRLAVCGLAMLAICGGNFVISKIGRRKPGESPEGRKNGRSETEGAVDATVVEEPKP